MEIVFLHIYFQYYANLEKIFGGPTEVFLENQLGSQSAKDIFHAKIFIAILPNLFFSHFDKPRKSPHAENMRRAVNCVATKKHK